MSEAIGLTPEQIDARRLGIGGSDVGAILGLNPWKTPLEVYLEKIGEGEAFEGNERTHFGNVLEDVVAQEYARRMTMREGSEVKVVRVNQPIKNDAFPYFAANIDRRVQRWKRVLECKTADKWMADKFGEEGSDEVPLAYLCQCMFYMMVTGYKTADLAVLIGGNEFRIYHIAYDQEVADWIEKECNAFWENNVLARVPPEPKTYDDLDLLYGAGKPGTVVEATPEIADAAIEAAVIRERIRQLEQKQDELNLKVRIFMEDRVELTDAVNLVDGQAQTLGTWKPQNKTVRFDTKGLKEDMPDVYETYMPEKGSAGQIRVYRDTKHVKSIVSEQLANN